MLLQRVILFRGKRTDNGEWVYGIPASFRKIDNVVRATMIPEIDGEHCMSECVCVDPDTVGQFTGLQDEDETPIFEGDIMWGCVGMSAPSYFEPPEPEYYKGKVRYDCGGFVFFVPDAHERGQNISYSLSEVYDNNGVKVIGNVHDNPELFEVK